MRIVDKVYWSCLGVLFICWVISVFRLINYIKQI